MFQVDLVQATIAIVLVCGAPGYFWSRVLFASLDWAERAAITVGLSLSLVPAAALLLAREFGPGITFDVSVAAVVIVTLSGAVAYLLLGKPRAPKPDTGLEVSPLTSLSLVPLVVASILIAVELVAVGVLVLESADPTTVALAARSILLAALPAPDVRAIVWETALLVAATAAIQLVSSELWKPATMLAGEGKNEENSKDREDTRAKDSPTSPEPVRRVPGLASLRRVLLPAVLLVTLVRGYLGPVLHDWPYIRGADQYPHAIMADLAMSRTTKDYGTYPPGFHVLSGVLSHASGLEPLKLYPFVAPALLLLPTLACYLLARQVLGPGYGVAAALFVGVIFSGPAGYFNDGAYPQLIAGDFLLVLAVASFVVLLSSPSVRSAVLVCVLVSSVVLYHGTSTLYLLVLLALIGMLFGPYLLYANWRAVLALMGVMVLIGSLSVTYAWETYDLQNTIAGLLNGTGPTPELEYVRNVVGTQQQPPELSILLYFVSEPVIYLGLLGGLLLLLLHVRRMLPSKALVVVLLVGWALLFFVGSQTSMSVSPARFTRDLGVPLSVLAAFGFVTIVRSFDMRKPVAIAAVLLVSLVVTLQAGLNLAEAIRPNRLLLMTPEIEAAGNWLREHNDGGNIVHASPYPNEAITAMGGYLRMSALTEAEMTVYEQVGREATWSILHQNDVRYVVLVEDLPNLQGQLPVTRNEFLEQPQLYTPVFENKDTIIFEVSDTLDSKAEAVDQAGGPHSLANPLDFKVEVAP